MSSRARPCRDCGSARASDALGGGGHRPSTQARSACRIRYGRGTWLSPDLSPDGKRIVFELLGDLYTMDAQGGEAHPIATGMAFESQPAFSPMA